MRNGRVYELQMQERPTSDSEYSSLPTPKARDHQAEGYEAGLRRASPQVGTILKGLVEGDERVTLLRSPKASEGQGGALGEAEARKRGNTVGVRDQIMDLVASQGHKVSRTEVNLPTPTVSDIFTGNLSSKQHSEGSLHSVSLAQIVHRADLLPTPIVRDYKDGQSEVLRDGKVQTDTVGRAVMNSGEIHGMSWGKFEPAIRRWEAILGRQAPSPTKADGKEGAHRLSSSFTEWMMGLPENWICGHDLKRNDELKLAGNGVVPQQAELALRLLLNSDEE
jgi:DNA (cytosine-5)-methyltransferase 1